MYRSASITAASDIGAEPESKIPDSLRRLNGAIGAKSGKKREMLISALFHALTGIGKF